jgi:hypothetical protein
VLENSYSRLNCAASTVSGSGTTLTVTWNVTFKASFVTSAVKNIYLQAADDAGASSGWSQKGAWLVGPNTAPAVGTVTPASGRSAADAIVSFKTTYSDANGYTQLATGYLLVNTALSGTNAAYGYYNQNANAFYWRNDADTATLGPCTPGQAAVLENSYSKLNCAASSVSGSGTTLTVTWNVTFKAPFVTTAVKNIYLQAADYAGASTGWVQKGTWLVGPNTAPAPGTLTPASGMSAAGEMVSFKTTYADANGYMQLATGYFLVNTALSATNAAYGYYNQNANAFYWGNDANTASLGPCAPGQAAVLENSYSKLNCAASTVSGSGTTLTITWNVTFKAPFVTTAVKNIYLQAADDAGASTGWSQKGTWLVGPNTAPAVGAVTPASGTSAADAMVNFTTTYTDANGYGQLATGYFLVNTALSGTNAAYGYYNQNDNALYWRNDAGTVWLGPCTPGQATVLENGYSKLDCAASTVSGSGVTLTVTWTVSFKAPFVTSAVKKIYLLAYDDAGASSGWVQKGTWQFGPEPPASGALLFHESPAGNPRLIGGAQPTTETRHH